MAGGSLRRLHGVAMDSSGIIPENLDRAFAEPKARVLYSMPTLQTPTGSVMPPALRQAIAEIVRRHDAYLLEDDAYGYLLSPPLIPRLPVHSRAQLLYRQLCEMPGAGTSHRRDDRARGISRRRAWRFHPQRFRVDLLNYDGPEFIDQAGGHQPLPIPPAALDAKVARRSSALRLPAPASSTGP
jgi:aminotransferase class I and II